MWLVYLDKMHKELEGDNFMPIDSRYCTRQKQRQIRRYHLDSFRMLPDGLRECFEFYGCYYHGCMECFPDHTKVVCCKYRENSYLTIERAYIDTIEQEREIKSIMVFNEDVDKWRVIWEHEYNEKDKEFKDYLGREESYNLSIN